MHKGNVCIAWKKKLHRKVHVMFCRDIFPPLKIRRVRYVNRVGMTRFGHLHLYFITRRWWCLDDWVEHLWLLHLETIDFCGKCCKEDFQKALGFILWRPRCRNVQNMATHPIVEMFQSGPSDVTVQFPLFHLINKTSEWKETTERQVRWIWEQSWANNRSFKSQRTNVFAALRFLSCLSLCNRCVVQQPYVTCL